MIKKFFQRLYTFVVHPSTLFLYKNFKGTVIYPGVILKGAKNMRLINSVIARGCSLKAFPGENKITISIENAYISDRGYISSNGMLSIKNASFGPNVFIGAYKHSIQSKEKDSGYSIVIDSPKLIGQNVSIFGNVNIEKGSVIGACSVVNKDCKGNSMYVGNPAHLIKVYDPNKDEWRPV